MFIVRCPYCNEQRTEKELSWGGEADIARPLDPQCAADDEWTEYLFMRPNPNGAITEQWCCTFGCGQWFKVRRDTVSNTLLAVLAFEDPNTSSQEPH